MAELHLCTFRYTLQSHSAFPQRIDVRRAQTGRVPAEEAAIEVRGVTLSWKENERPAVNDVSFQVCVCVRAREREREASRSSLGV